MPEGPLKQRCRSADDLSADPYVLDFEPAYQFTDHASGRQADEVGHLHVDFATVDSVQKVVESGRREPEIPAYQNLAAYRAAGGYSILESCGSGARSMHAVIGELSDGGLRGLGGAGFPAGRKWPPGRAPASLF